VIEHAGHAPFLTRADAVADRLQDFLRAQRSDAPLQAAS
jgi:hypothetical protein